MHGVWIVLAIVFFLLYCNALDARKERMFMEVVRLIDEGKITDSNADGTLSKLGLKNKGLKVEKHD